MEELKNTENPKEIFKKKRLENQEKAMDMMFGKNRHEYAGNIWGWKFSMISLIGIGVVVIFMIIGILSGKINLNDQVEQAKEAQEEKKTALERTDSLNKDKK
jgi:uncharacterized membrane protein